MVDECEGSRASIFAVSLVVNDGREAIAYFRTGDEETAVGYTNVAVLAIRAGGVIPFKAVLRTANDPALVVVVED